jgi:hypothetical protein
MHKEDVMKRNYFISMLAAACLGLSACSETKAPESTAVYMLLDTSGTYTQELDKAEKIVNFLLMKLDSGDSVAVARIDSGSFSEKDIIAKVTFDDRPSTTNEQKRAFKRMMDDFISNNKKGSAHTDISGGILQATEFLNETNATNKYIFVFSDLEEELAKGHVRDFTLPLTGIEVEALNVTKLRSDNVNPKEYLTRLDQWQQKVIKGGGQWKVVNDIERLDRLLGNS